jgi:DNA mismatch repair protein MSH5
MVNMQLHGWICRHLVVDGPTLAALGVFKEERHPSNMGIGVAKEGFSLFGLLNRCVSQMVSRQGHSCGYM